MDNKFMPIAVKIAELVQEKNTAYGDAAGKSVEYLKLLYPNGVRPEQYQNMLLLVRDFDKNMRIATNEDALGESPWGDKAGYALLAVELKGRKQGREVVAAVDIDSEQGQDKSAYDCSNCDRRSTNYIHGCMMFVDLTLECRNTKYSHWIPERGATVCVRPEVTE